MINRFNRAQVLKAVFAFLLSLFSLGLAFLFFWYALGAFSLSFEWNWGIGSQIGGASVIVLLIFIGGLINFSRGHGHTELSESDLVLGGLDGSTGGSHFVGHYARRVTGPAYILSQLFLAGPLQMGKAYRCLRSRIPYSRDLESDLAGTLAFARAKARWHDVSGYSGRERYLSYLIRMGLVEYSSRKGRVRYVDHA